MQTNREQIKLVKETSEQVARTRTMFERNNLEGVSFEQTDLESTTLDQVNFEQIDREQIHIQAVKSAKAFKSNQIQLIKDLQLVDKYKVYRTANCSSLYKYTVHILGLAEHQALELIAVARAAARFEKLQASLEKGQIHIGKARRLSSILTMENQEDWIKLATTSSQRELERQIATVNPRAGIKEQAIYVSEKDLAFTACISEETYRLLKRAQDVLSQKKKTSVSWDESLKATAQSFLAKHDPVRKAERVLRKAAQKHSARAKENNMEHSARAEQSNSQESDNGFSNSKKAREETSHSKLANLKNTEKYSARAERKPLAAHLIHEVHNRDHGKCQGHVLGFGECYEERFVDMHHIVQVSQGGRDTLENLITLCSGHHRVVHDQA